MSAPEDSSSSDDETAPIREDINLCLDLLDKSSATTISEGNVISIDSMKSTENIVSMSVMPQSEETSSVTSTNKESGDTTKDIIYEDVDTDKNESLQSSEQLSTTEIGKGSGDHTAICEDDSKSNDQSNSNLNIPTTSKSDINDRIETKVGGETSGVDICDEELDDDDDMKLRWDDDGENDQARETDNDKIIDTDVNDTVLFEQKLLEDQVTSGKVELIIDKDDDIVSEKLLLEDQVESDGNENLSIVKNDDTLSEKLLPEVQDELDGNEKLQTVENDDILMEKLLLEDQVVTDDDEKLDTVQNDDDSEELLKDPVTPDVSENLDIVKKDDIFSEELLLEDEVVADGNQNLDTVKNDDVLFEEKLLEEKETVSGISSKKNILLDKSKETYKAILEKDTLLNEPVDTKIPEDSVEKDISNEKTVIQSNVLNVGDKNIQDLEVQPSTSSNKMTPDKSDTVPEVSDSLEFLAESSSNMIDDEVPVITNILVEKKTRIDDNILNADTLIMESCESANIMQEESPLVEPIVISSERHLDTNVTLKEDFDKISDIQLEDNLLDVNDEIAEPPDFNPEMIVSIDDVDPEKEEELLRDDQHEDPSSIAMDIDNVDESTEDQDIMCENKITTQLLSDSNKADQKPDSTMEMDIEVDLNSLNEDDNEAPTKKATLDIPVKNKLDVLPTEHLTESYIQNAETDFNQIISPVESPIHIKTDHGLHKPDVMLEIPTQEFIDIDEVDLPINLDASGAIDSPNVVESILNSDDEGVQQCEKTIDQIALVTKDAIAKAVTDDNSSNKNPENVENTVLKPTIEESLEVMFADDGSATVNQDALCQATTSKIVQDVDVQPSTTSKTVEDVDVQSSTSKTVQDVDVQPSTTSKIVQDVDVRPSTSFNKMTPDTSDEIPEVSDSLGLLAESSGRMMEDDEEPDDDDEGDEDDDFEDESSNQISAEQSEDSNTPHSETEPVKDLDEKDIDTPDAKDEFQFNICAIESTSQDKMENKDAVEISTEYGNLELPADTVQDDGETQSAVDALLKEVEETTQEAKGGVNEDPADQQMDIETVKLSDTSDNEVEANEVDINEMDITEVDINEVELDTKYDDQTAAVKDQTETKEQSNEDTEGKQEQTNQSPSKRSPSKLSVQSPSKMKKLEITAMENSQIVNIVDLEESSSSEEDIQEVQKQSKVDTPLPEEELATDPDSVTKVNIPSGIEVMCTSGGSTSEMVTKEGEVVISGIPKPPPHKPARLNTSEVSIKTVSTAEPLVIPETKMTEQTSSDQTPKTKLSLEIFSLDSDEDESAAKEKPVVTSPHKMTAVELETARETSKCINYCCSSGNKVPYKVADAATVAYYDAGRKRRAMVCQPCAEVVNNRTKNLIQGIKDMTPLLELDMSKLSQDLVEISDSESEDEDTTPEEPKESIGEKGAKLLEENLATILNETWYKYDLETRLKETQIMLDDEIEKLELDSKEIDAMLNECQIATDKLRCDLYATFECRRQENPAFCIHDTPETKYIGPEVDSTTATAESMDATVRQMKRRLSSASETPPKRPAIPLGYAPLDTDTSSTKDPKVVAPSVESKLDDDKDISVVQLSAESAPADLPPSGEISRPPIRVGMPVYAMKNAFGPWLKGRILDIQPRNPAAGHPYPMCRIKFDHKAKNSSKVLPARCVAYAEPADVRMTIGTRLIALFKDSNKRESYYSGVVAEIPNPVNNYRYLVFFDDGYAQYVQHGFTRLVCECAHLVWDEVHPFSREFVKQYLITYPERPMVRLHEGQHLKTEWNGKWWSSRVIRVDASLAQVLFLGDGRREWIYRGSTRLAPLYLELRAAERHRPRPMPRSKAQPRLNMPYVEYTRSDEPESKQQQDAQTQQQQNEEIRRQRAVAKKSTTAPPTQMSPPSPLPQPQPPPTQQQPGSVDTVTSRVVYYTPKSAVKPYKMVPHKCNPMCKRSDVLSLKELRTYNPLAKPLLSGWERQIVRFKGHKDVMYRAPCGRRLRNMHELHQYLRAVDSELPVDLFDFHYSTHCLAEFVLNKCLVGKKDLSHGKENVPVPCVNYYDDSLPEFCSYNTERTPTAGVPLNLDPEFLCGCDCTDDCQDKTKCACWKMTLEGARTIGLDYPDVGYVHKRLPEPLPSGIYECNSRCKCKHTCLNRVAQHPLQLKLQVFKTLNRGWGIRALNDVPKGSFLCVYAGNLLTDATANLDGLNEGDEYLAELDYIEVVEQMKEGYEEDIPATDKKLDKKEKHKEDDDDEEDEPVSSEEEGSTSKTDKEDDDFRPGYIGLGVAEFNKRLRRREKSKKEKQDKKGDEKEKDKEKESKEGNGEDDCITISDDEEVREPSRFTVQAGMGANEFISKYKSVRTLFGKDEACYIMDAKVQGNIGRYLNHSCCPNVFVQNVFVDTHDPRFPWVAFFALSHIKAGTELTWNYNYDVGSVPGKVLYCFCGAPNCRGRLL